VAWLCYIVTAIGAYLLGSIPSGFLVGRAKGIDIRKVGSGNIGATNVFRILGKPAGVVVMAADTLKGLIAVGIVPHVLYWAFPSASELAYVSRDYLGVVAGVFAVLGHNYTFWLWFRGGKGVATTGGVLLALSWLGFVLSAGVWLLVLALSRYVSLASIAAGFSLPFSVWISGGSPTRIAVFAIIGALAIVKHRANIQRLLNGTEHRFGWGKGSTV
jgi:acyl phosphate:glycerol-3-phosphate acyltransferase